MIRPGGTNLTDDAAEVLEALLLGFDESGLGYVRTEVTAEWLRKGLPIEIDERSPDEEPSTLRAQLDSALNTIEVEVSQRLHMMAYLNEQWEKYRVQSYVDEPNRLDSEPSFDQVELVPTELNGMGNRVVAIVARLRTEQLSEFGPGDDDA